MTTHTDYSGHSGFERRRPQSHIEDEQSLDSATQFTEPPSNVTHRQAHNIASMVPSFSDLSEQQLKNLWGLWSTTGDYTFKIGEPEPPTVETVGWIATTTLRRGTTLQENECTTYLERLLANTFFTQASGIV